MENSTLECIESGVPQGSILAAMLFSLMINDLSDVTSVCNKEMFADDVQTR